MSIGNIAQTKLNLSEICHVTNKITPTKSKSKKMFEKILQTCNETN